MNNQEGKSFAMLIIDDVIDGNIPGLTVAHGVPPKEEITRCTQCGKKFTPVRRPATTWNRNIFGGIDVLCRQCVARNERASSAAIEEVLRERKAREDKLNNKP